MARGLGQVLANLVNLLNPQVIVLGGALAGVFGCARAEVLRELDAQAMTAARAMVDIRVSALGGGLLPAGRGGAQPSSGCSADPLRRRRR